MEKHGGSTSNSEEWLLLESRELCTHKVHEDKWIPSDPTNKLLHPAYEESKDWLVSELIDPELH